MTTVKVILGSLVILASALPMMAEAQVGRPGGDRRPDRNDRIDRIDRIDERIDRNQVIRMSQTLVRNVDQVERLVRSEATSYRPIERRAIQVIRELASRSRDLGVAARQGANRRQMIRHLQDVQNVAERARDILVRANFSLRVDREFNQVRIVLRQLANEIRDLDTIGRMRLLGE